jgi:plasmid maintenance system antidote protein VapI
MDQTEEKKRPSGGELLLRWMERHRVSYYEAARRFGCSHATVRRLVRNEVACDVDLAARIESAAPSIRMRAWVGNKS